MTENPKYLPVVDIQNVDIPLQDIYHFQIKNGRKYITEKYNRKYKCPCT